MRLLNTSTLKLEEFPANKIPRHAILSHTWGPDEVIFPDFQQKIAESKTSWSKVLGTCQQARKDEFEYVWIDNCCINKDSSAELSESINSMYRWYEKAEICYAYLADVPGNVDLNVDGSAFEKSRWFSRGWTLQELLAPSEVIFYSSDWIELGRKSTLSDILSQITGVPEDILMHQRPLSSASVARRMSWAADRETTRLEDIAYCLMGIFSVNMPMIYGEGEKAFVRLQEEIMKSSDDQSIFAWTDTNASPTALRGLLASSPSDFARCGSVISYQDWEPRAPYAMTNRGLQIDLPISGLDDGIYLAALDCPCPPDYKNETFLAIYLKRTSTVNHQYARIKVGSLAQVQSRGTTRTIFVRQSEIIPSDEGLFPKHFLWLRQFRKSSPFMFSYAIFADRTIGTLAQSDKSGRLYPADMKFAVDKNSRSLSGFLVTRRLDDVGVLILLGSNEGIDAGFDALETRHARDFTKDDLGALSKRYQPKKPGLWVTLQHHRVRVHSQPHVEAGAKYYLIDAEVESIECNTVQTGVGQSDTMIIPKKVATMERETARRESEKKASSVWPWRRPKA
ncbi:hypothetical protein ASPWEDRAFT_122800 [Aspergillus wentii DTO 134E9]|uniref:Uncharacterized protein n=1 Tax=Aspergillus wentii DTO 134E9 TaxID=1073089 RepID=A0A1L9RZ02_ASPWE|nr:uncharacterized protein ASPWEDRAFT_122800 [Aspergillus wentii DTO 134E9]KAI9932591.1 hypothetical protein MW887_008836 [Aspergillus wentii]OJJ40159.1 hypothetical protein ASPWEDRAFT_122800 [Aspergillus wentii DTO 134E9]